MKETDERYDPLKVAEVEGKLFAKGVSGNYRKNKATLVGYFLLGLLFIAQGGSLLWISLDGLLGEWNDEAISMCIIFGFFGLFLLAVGIFFMKNVFIRRT